MLRIALIGGVISTALFLFLPENVSLADEPKPVDCHVSYTEFPELGPTELPVDCIEAMSPKPTACQPKQNYGVKVDGSVLFLTIRGSYCELPID